MQDLNLRFPYGQPSWLPNWLKKDGIPYGQPSWLPQLAKKLAAQLAKMAESPIGKKMRGEQGIRTLTSPKRGRH